MALHPVSRVKLSTQIENQLKDQILTGKWKPGERLPSENELAEIFQVSRVSIRQALQALSAQGLIETRIGDGSFISQPSIGTFMQDVIPDVYLADDSLRAVLEFRRVFEGPVAELAATRATDEQKLASCHRFQGTQNGLLLPRTAPQCLPPEKPEALPGSHGGACGQ